ncbi:methionyl-tRNA formyltransferase [Mycoplasmopsis felis]|uniref:methionyl-tRNA formyltransferase n=1 Tax=Mycoplasmopsis felis TaxID=33923 RepID=UPI0021AFFB3C|nr:methionyl-tRNA formyltransferase [Mycoplasmopsis felis]MCU9931903.1 methionyl-tRNA formyltransferase [Mycoplasmopsis felis]UWV78357.1 methionyl-tRNA formyltransferase [Mycoplasmopsis felis]UWW00515.1 methionyl-tRNA formyltransferase [Mycoplasmopsis felis]WAM02445.1 methionyl-tRNA formyltransferase [Mycoplasmopsis felis]WQQ04086.1 methionyl-tRNA formyltransferase [Mycoplasmopsis felis]
MNKTKIVLLGTPEFAIKPFKQIIENFNVIAIISQPNKPANRGYQIQETPVAKLAKEYGIKLYQPNKISEIYIELNELDFDILLSCAFGQYIPMNILELPKIASINIHGSLLPKYRGAAPIQYSLLNGDTETGISLIYMTKEMDAGNIIFSESIPIENTDTSDTLFEKLSELSSLKIVYWLNKFISKDFQAVIQNTNEVILSPKLKKEDALLTLDLTKQQAFNKIRAFSSNPGAYLYLNNKRLKIYLASLSQIKNAIELKFSDGSLWAIDYQYESKKRIKIKIV